MPLLYSGEEIGQPNDFSYLSDPLKEGDNRWVHRPPMDWERVERRHDEGTVEQRLFDGLGDLVAARKSSEQLHTRATERVLETGNGAVFALERTRDGDALLSLSNFSGNAQAVDIGTLPERWQTGAYESVVDGETLRVPDGRMVLGPYEYLWLEPVESTSPESTVETTISLAVDTEWGESVALVGPSDHVGSWEMTEAVPLAYGDGEWQTTLELPADTTIEFEWVKIRDSEVVEWSPQRYAVQAGDDKILGFEKP
jgi:amylosucrase